MGPGRGRSEPTIGDRRSWDLSCSLPISVSTSGTQVGPSSPAEGNSPPGRGVGAGADLAPAGRQSPASELCVPRLLTPPLPGTLSRFRRTCFSISPGTQIVSPQ